MDIPPYERVAFEQEIARTLSHDMAVFADRCRQNEQRCYALVSAGQCEEIKQDCQDDSRMARLVQRHALEVEALFQHTAEAALASIGPWLIELPLSSQGAAVAPELLHELALEAGVVHALSMVSSPLRSLTLANHLRSWMRGLILPDPSLVGDEAVGAVLRWFDPRIGFDMVSLWPESEQRDFMRAFTWAGWDARFEPRGTRCSRPRAPASAERTEPLPLDMPLLQAIAPLSRAEELLDDVRQQAEAKAFDHIAPALQRWVASLVSLAWMIRLGNEDQKLPGFGTHAEAQDVAIARFLEKQVAKDPFHFKTLQEFQLRDPGGVFARSLPGHRTGLDARLKSWHPVKRLPARPLNVQARVLCERGLCDAGAALAAGVLRSATQKASGHRRRGGLGARHAVHRPVGVPRRHCLDRWQRGLGWLEPGQV